MAQSPYQYDAQIAALLDAEVRVASEDTPRTSLFARPNEPDDDLRRALEDSTLTAAAANHSATITDDEERLRLAIAISQSTQPDAAAAAAAPRQDTDEQLLREATAASEHAYVAERTEHLGAVLGVLRACAPILASYMDEHCSVFVDGATDTDAIETEVFTDYRSTVDQLLTDLLAEVGMGLGDVARTLMLARQQPADDESSLVEHLLAVESFDSFRHLMTQRNEAIHRQARAGLPQRPAALTAPVLVEATAFATVRESGRSGPPTVEMVRIERERDELRLRNGAGASASAAAALPPSRLADALAELEFADSLDSAEQI